MLPSTIIKSVFILLFSGIYSLQAQRGGNTFFDQNYRPIICGDTAGNAVVASTIKKRYQFLVDSLSGQKKDKKQMYLTAYNEKYEHIRSFFSKDQLLWGDTLSHLSEGIIGNLVKANPALQKQYYVYTVGTSIPNAFSVGDGLVFVNLGLLSRMRNQGELAFVLAHELAHDYLNHSMQSMVKYVETMSDKSTKDKMHEVAKSEYNAYHQMESLSKNLMLDFNTHSRQHESEADSLAVIWMTKAGYAETAALSALQLLDSIDKEKFELDINYKGFFDSPDYPFKDEWLKQADFMQAFKSKEEAQDKDNDTLKTHPDCKKRIAAIEQRYPGERKALERQDATMAQMNTIADFEIVTHQYERGLYGVSLYNTLSLLQLYPANTYLHAMVGKNCYFLYKAIKDHTFSHHTDMPHPYFDNRYNQFLSFINNLRSSEFAAIAIAYLKKNQPAQSDAQFDFAQILCLSTNPEKTSIENLTMEYCKSYPNTSEAIYLKERLLIK